MLLVQILGGIFGLTIAWLMHRAYEWRQDQILEEYRLQQQLELENYKQSLKKSS